MLRCALVLVGMMLSCVPALAGGVADADAGIARLGAGDASAAVELFTRAIQSKELSPDGLALTYHHRGMAFHKEGQAGRAILDYSTALWNRNLPREFKPRTLNNRGLAFEAMGEFESAMRDYALAIRLNANYAEAFSNRGSLHRRFNRHDQAILDYDMALRNGHPYPKFVFTWQGMSLEAQGKRREAMDAYRRALSIDPAFELAKTQLLKLEQAQGLDSVLGRRKVVRSPSAPLVLTATPGSQMSAVSPESEAMKTPWSPPPPKGVVVKPPPPPALEPENGFSLRRAVDDDRPREPVTEIVVPKKKDAVVAPKPAAEIQAAAKPSAAVAVPVESLPTGRGGSDVEYGIQVGSFTTAEQAESGWTNLLKRAGDLLGGLSHVVEPVNIPEKGTVYRLVAEALPDRDAALGLCRTLRDKGAVCIVVRR
jgi:tetratricopeptide (TPR) repeat protein